MKIRNLKLSVLLILILNLAILTPPLIGEETDVIKIQRLVKQLGAAKSKDRKIAISLLIKEGYYARVAIKEALKSRDPEIQANAHEVWAKIKDIITPHHSKEVEIFIRKFKEDTAQNNDWLDVLRQLNDHSLELLITVINHQQTQINGKLKKFIKKTNQQNKVTTLRLIELTLQFFPSQKLFTMATKLSENNKKNLLKIILSNISSASSHEQFVLLRTADKIALHKNILPILEEINLYSKIPLNAISPDFLSYLKNHSKEFTILQQYIAMHILKMHKYISKDELIDFCKKQPLSTVNDNIVRLFYHHYSHLIPVGTWTDYFKKNKFPWHKLASLTLQNKITVKTLTELELPAVTKRSQMINLADEFFDFNNPLALPLFNKSMNFRKDMPTVQFDETELLIKHSCRVGDYVNALKLLELYNKNNGRKDHQNSNFYDNQQAGIKEETKLLLQTVSTLQKKPKAALALLNKAALSNPKIATIFIQKAEFEHTLGLTKDATISFTKAANLIPENALEIRSLINIAFDLDNYALAESQLNRLVLNDNNIMNFVLAASTFEFFGQLEKAHTLQKKLEMTSFGKVRNLFYQAQYKQIPDLCTDPDEGDFQFLWGIMAMNLSGNSDKVSDYCLKYSFEDHWPKTIADMLIENISIQQLIDECYTTTSISEQRGRLTEAYFYIACKYLEKDKNKAKIYFQKSLDLKFREYYEYISASTMLKSLK